MSDIKEHWPEVLFGAFATVALGSFLARHEWSGALWVTYSIAWMGASMISAEREKTWRAIAIEGGVRRRTDAAEAAEAVYLALYNVPLREVADTLGPNIEAAYRRQAERLAAAALNGRTDR